MARYLLLFDSYGLVFMGRPRPLWREDGSVLCICCWPFPAQSFSDPRVPWDNILLSRIWDFPFRRLLRLARSRWRYSTPPPHGPHYIAYNKIWDSTTSPRYIAPARPYRKRLFHYCVFSSCQGNNVLTKLFPSNGCCTIACYLPKGLHVTVWLPEYCACS
jgi:hypothetical protein